MEAAFHGYQSLIENSPDAISLINNRGEILYGSPAHTTLLGYRPDELVGRDCLELLHPEDRGHSSSILREVTSRVTHPRSWDARIRRKDGTYCWVESTASNLTADREVQAIVVHQRNIHERMEAQEKSKAQARELILSQRQMEEFAYTVAHDLREPLRAISLYTQLLFSKAHLDEETKEMAQFVIAGATRMSSMITDLLTFARTGMPAPPALFNLQVAVDQALQNLTLEIQESGATVTVAPLPGVFSDQGHLVRVFQNLISNAIKYRSKRPLTILVTCELSDVGFVVKVRDNGLGIDPAYQAKIFLPFTRLAHRDVPGTGLGLAVCKKTIEGLGGTIGVDSELDVGSTFVFTLAARIPEERPR